MNFSNPKNKEKKPKDKYSEKELEINTESLHGMMEVDLGHIELKPKTKIKTFELEII